MIVYYKKFLMSVFFQALNQICRAADDLINIANPTIDEGAIKRLVWALSKLDLTTILVL